MLCGVCSGEAPSELLGKSHHDVCINTPSPLFYFSYAQTETLGRLSSKYCIQMGNNQASPLSSDRPHTHTQTHAHSHACMLTLAHVHSL